MEGISRPEFLYRKWEGLEKTEPGFTDAIKEVFKYSKDRKDAYIGAALIAHIVSEKQNGIFY